MAHFDNLTLDGDPIIPKPTRVIPHPPKGVVWQSPTDGGFAGFARQRGWWWELEWGSELIDDETLVAIKAFFDSISDPSGSVQFGFDWLEGQSEEFNVIWDEEVAAPIRWSSVNERLVITLYEAADNT